MCIFFLGIKTNNGLKKLRSKYFSFFNKNLNVFNFIYIKNFLNYLFFFFKNINRKKLLVVSDKITHYKNKKIKFFNYYFDKSNFKRKFLIYNYFLRTKLKLFFKIKNFFFFFITTNKYYLKRLTNSFVCSKLIILSNDNNTNFSQFLFKAPVFYNFNFSINFYFYFFKFFN